MGNGGFHRARLIPWRLVLFGNFLWTLLVVTATGATCAKVPMGIAWPWILLLMVLVVLGCLLRLRKGRLSAATIITIGSVFVFLIAVLSRYLFGDTLQSGYPDTWAYCADAEYLTRFVRGTDPGIVPLYIFASTLSNTRFGSFSILAFLARVLHLDAVHVLAYYTAFLLCNIFWGVALLSRLYGAKPFVSLVSGAYAAVCGLIPDTVIMGAMDNLLFLSVFPFLIIRLQLSTTGNGAWSSIFGLAFSASAVFYAYPEGLAAAGVVFLPIFISCLLKIFRHASAWRSCLLPVGLFILLVAPYLTTFFDHLRNQLLIGAAAIRVAQGALSGLISDNFLPAIFGFGDEFPGGAFKKSHFVLAVVCLGFLAISIVRQRRKNRFIILSSIFLLLLCAIWQGLILRYDYGLFKFLVVGSLFTTPLLFSGIQFASQLSWLKSLSLAAPAIALLVTLCAFAERRETKRDYLSNWGPQIGPYSELKKIKKLVADSPVRLSFESADALAYGDGLDQLWAAYFLRDVNLDIPHPRLYLKGLLQRLSYRSWREDIDPSVKFFLSNRPQKTAIWSNKRFYLATERELNRLIVDSSPNGIDAVNGEPLIWIGNSPLQLNIISEMGGPAYLSAKKVLIGPSCSEISGRNVCVKSGEKIQNIHVDKTSRNSQTEFSVRVNLKPGNNKLEVWCTDKPDVLVLPNGDSRTLLVALINYAVD
jgi:hypothetical protein